MAKRISTGITKKVKFRGWQYERSRRRLEALLHLALIGEPGSGKTMVAKMLLIALFGTDPETLTHEELDAEFHRLILDESFQYMQGTESAEPMDLTGAFVKSTKVYCTKCAWETVVYEGRRHLSCPDCSSTKISTDELGLGWRDGPLTKAMKNGTPFFFNEMSRCDQPTQDVLMAPCSEGVLSIPAIGQTVIANDGFVVIADMNSESHDARVHSFCWALGSRLRKVQFGSPPADTVRKILKDRLESPTLVAPLSRLYNEVATLYADQHVQRPMIVRGLLEMAIDIGIEMQYDDVSKAFVAAAESTWVDDVVGTRSQGRERVMGLVRKMAESLSLDKSGAFTSRNETELDSLHNLFTEVFKIPRTGINSTKNISEAYGIPDWTGAWDLLSRKTQFRGVKGVGLQKRVALKANLYRTCRVPGQIVDRYDDLLSTTVAALPVYRQGDLLEFAVKGAGRQSFMKTFGPRGIETFKELQDFYTTDKVALEQAEPKIAEWCEQNLDGLTQLARHEVIL